ncbi:SAM-dependent methyltransferase [Methylacidiphilum caldifontis]|uniref:class I SAM-dependent methyltransferase n=1 Tax=Methylacidiphilum caldifontis TaxID=2795386 RepID=UPI001A8D85EC|nr:SAM-dependent methyltransferase [Methylacidiphilum caldifontis]QSR89071.1 SAM-dependent methyltransferase [Methylacidiphilum caldifontis]
MITEYDSQTPLLQEILCLIKNQGPIPFDTYMSIHQSHPLYGYYSRGTRKRIGKRGDFFTSVSVGSLFGESLAMQCSEAWKQLKMNGSLWIVEAGAGGAELACDIVDWLDKNEADLSKQLSYLFIEPFSHNQKEQQREIEKRIGKTDRFCWVTGCEDLPSFCSPVILIANEFLDSLPVKRITFRNGCWMEQYVGINKENKLNFIELPLSARSGLDELIKKLPLPQIEGYTTEIHTEALKWITKLAQKLNCCLLFIIDYGLAEEEYFAPWRSNGTLRCYKNHKIFSDPFLFVGMSDITTHLNFSLIVKTAEENGMEPIGWLDQHHFFMGCLEKWHSRDPLFLSKNPQREQWIRKFFMLSHPLFMGNNFKFLLLSKNLPLSLKLPGLKFCQSKKP